MSQTPTTHDELQQNDDVVVLLREQHERIKQLIGRVEAAAPAERGARFDELRTMLAMHETAEELVVRPVTSTLVAQDVTSARNAEEKEASAQLAALEKLDADSLEFEQSFARFAPAVLRHAMNEESLEFPHLLTAKNAQERSRMGKALRAAEAMAPTRPHPSAAGSPGAQLVTGPFASMVDRIRDAMTKK